MEDIQQKEDKQQEMENPQRTIENCSNEILVKVLLEESLHTAALIISGVSLEKKAALLELVLLRLSETQQKMLLLELARGTCELTDCVRLIEADIAEKIKRLTNKRYMRIGGSDFVSKVINLMDASSRNAVFNLLKNKNTALYEAVKADTFIFEDIVRLSDLAIQKMLRKIDAVQLAQALVTAPPEVKQKIMHNMSKRAAAMVEEEIETMDMIDTKTVENAQGAITDSILRLEKNGEIIIPSAK